jgi:hypothetical protein
MNVRKIPVGSSDYAIVDDVDYLELSRHTWTLLEGHNGKKYALHKHGREILYMHRIVAGTPKGYETDHVNGDGLDNRRCNLRHATASENRANMGKPARPEGAIHTSKFKGVTWDKSRGKWQAKIQVNGTHKNLGRFLREEDAAHAYDSAAIAAWGEFASVNYQFA